MDVLVSLMARSGAVVSTEEILSEVWPGCVVEPSGIHQRIFQIRRALGDDRRSPKYIESVPKRGYRIATFVRAGTREGSGPYPTRLRVAVLTLQDLTPDGELAWLCIGLSEELRFQIDGWPQFTVLPGAFTEHWHPGGPPPDEIELLVHGFVEGATADVCVRLNVVDARSRRTIWARRFEGHHDDPLELQRQIAPSIARFFGESTGGIPAPTRRGAYAAFLRLLNYRYFGAFDEHSYWLRQTLEQDPDWHWGWGDLAIAHLRSAALLRDDSLLEQAREIIRNTPRSDSAQQILSLAEFFLKAYFDDDLSEAHALARDMAIGGYGYPYGTLLVSSGLAAHAEPYFRHYTERKPYRPVAWEWLALARANAGNWRGALDAARQVARLFPADATGPPVVLSWVLFEAGDLEDAERLLEELKSLRDSQVPGSVQRRATEVLGYRNLAFRVAVAKGDHARALAAADWFAEQGFGVNAGILYLRMQDARAEKALAAADPRFDRFWGWVTTLMIPPDLQGHPLLADTRARLGFGEDLRRELRAEVQEMPAWRHLR